MKRLWIAIGILLLVFVAVLVNTRYLNRFTADLSDQLTRAEIAAEAGNWADAQALTGDAWDEWQSRDSYLHVVLRHSDTDTIYTGFREVQALIDAQEDGEYSAANAVLIARIGLLYGSEQLTLKNLF